MNLSRGVNTYLGNEDSTVPAIGNTLVAQHAIMLAFLRLQFALRLLRYRLLWRCFEVGGLSGGFLRWRLAL